MCSGIEHVHVGCPFWNARIVPRKLPDARVLPTRPAIGVLDLDAELWQNVLDGPREAAAAKVEAR